MSVSSKARVVRLPPEVNRILFVRNLPFKITAEEMYEVFGKYGPVRQIRVGSTAEKRGTAFVVYEDIYDAKTACEHLSGFNIGGRYLVVLYYQPAKAAVDIKAAEAEVAALRAKVAAGEAAAAGGGGSEGDELDDEEDRKLMRR